MAEKIDWIKVAESPDDILFGTHQLAEIKAGDKTVCIGKHNGELFAFASKCPHASGAFAAGWIDGQGNVVCPVHRYKFCLQNGRNVSGEGYYLKHWPVEVREDGVFVGFETKRFFGLL